MSESLDKVKHLLHLHACEQEGLASGQPKPAEWLKAVDEANEAVNELEADKELVCANCGVSQDDIDIVDEAIRIHEEGWIDVAVRLPVAETSCLVRYRDGHEDESFFWGEREGFDPYADPLHFEVTHWKEKPCGCQGNCACAENFKKSADMKKHFEKNGSIFDKPKRVEAKWLYYIAFTHIGFGYGKTVVRVPATPDIVVHEVQILFFHIKWVRSEDTTLE